MTDTAKLFLSDYASYNEGSQFEFGHWVELDQFSDASEFSDYITNHFRLCDAKSPLMDGCPREEPMITDYEGFPEQLYSESMSPNEMEQLFTFLQLGDKERLQVEILLQHGYEMPEALECYENINPIEWDYSFVAKYELAEMYYPEAERATEICDYISFDYDRFIDNEFTEFTIDGTDYLVSDGDFA